MNERDLGETGLGEAHVRVALVAGARLSSGICSGSWDWWAKKRTLIDQAILARSERRLTRIR